MLGLHCQCTKSGPSFSSFKYITSNNQTAVLETLEADVLLIQTHLAEGKWRTGSLGTDKICIWHILQFAGRIRWSIALFPHPLRVIVALVLQGSTTKLYLNVISLQCCSQDQSANTTKACIRMKCQFSATQDKLHTYHRDWKLYWVSIISDLKERKTGCCQKQE